MRNAIIADLIRVQKKKSFFLLLGIEVCLIILAATLSMVFDLMDKNTQFKTFVSLFDGMVPLMIGIPIFLAVFSDDFKSHAMQVSIGFGLSRTKLILSRIIETVLLILESGVVVAVTLTVMALIAGVDMSVLWERLGTLGFLMLLEVCHISVCMMIVYAMQGATLALVAYILMALGVIDGMLATLTLIPAIEEAHIHPEWIFPGRLLTSLAMNPEFNYGWVVWILVPIVYIVLPVWLSTVIFRKKELEF